MPSVGLNGSNRSEQDIPLMFAETPSQVNDEPWNQSIAARNTQRPGSLHMSPVFHDEPSSRIMAINPSNAHNKVVWCSWWCFASLLIFRLCLYFSAERNHADDAL